MYQFSFEKLEVWQLSRQLNLSIYRLSLNFPLEDKFILTSQMRSSSNSIASNIAEGCHRSSYNEKLRYINIAYASSMELLNHLILSCDLNWIDESEYISIRKQINEIALLLTKLSNSYREKIK